MSRKSIGRNVYGETWKEKFTDLQLSTRTADGASLAASSELVVGCWESGGGGTVGVISIEHCGKRNPPVTKFRGHKGPVQDIQFSPFYATIFATASDDGTIKLWDCPLVKEAHLCRDAVATLMGHDRKVCCIALNHVAEWILASGGIDCTVRTWDFEVQKCVRTATASQSLSCLKWNYDGSLLAYTTKDHFLRILDPRQNDEVAAVKCHDGAKPIKCEWIGGERSAFGNQILSSGFSKLADRQIALWDARNLSDCLQRIEVDRQSSTISPVYDEGTGLLFLSGKGDGNVRFYEYRDGSIEKLGVYASNEPAREIAFAPKRGVNVMKCEVMRGYKVQGTSTIQPLSFYVPRRNMTDFQADIFPPCHGGDAALTAEEWLGGKVARPILKSMEPINGVSPFHLRKRPVNVGNLAFDQDREHTAIRAAPSVLVKQITAQGKAHDEETEKLRHAIQELKSQLSAKDSQLRVLTQKLETLNSLKTEEKPVVGTLTEPPPVQSPVQMPNVPDISEELRRTQEEASATISVLQDLRQEAGIRSRVEFEELRKLIEEHRVHDEHRLHDDRRGHDRVIDEHRGHEEYSPPADTFSAEAVDDILRRMMELQKRNQELEALFTQLRSASRSKKNGSVEVYVRSQQDSRQCSLLPVCRRSS